MKRITLLSLLFSGVLLAQSEIGTVKLTNGTELSMYDGSNSAKKEKIIRGFSVSSFGPFAFNGDYLHFFNKDGEFSKEKVKEIESVNLKDQMVFLPLEIKKNRPRLMQLIAKTNKYILANFESNGLSYFYIYDLDYNPIEKQIIHTASKKKSEKAIEEVKVYFSDCEELISGLETNFSKPTGKGLQARYYLTYHIEDGQIRNFLSNINCSNQ